MEKTIYREEAIKKFNKPDELTDYLKILSPKLWVILLAIAVLMIGACIWGYCVFYVK